MSSARKRPGRHLSGTVRFTDAPLRCQKGILCLLVGVIKNYLDLSHLSEFSAIGVLIFISLAVRYFFVSNSAFVVSFYPVLFHPRYDHQAEPMYVALSLAFSAGYGALLTHYGNGAGVFTFSSGYVPQKPSGCWAP